MPREITVEKIGAGGAGNYRVTVAEGGGSTEHFVSVESAYRDRLVGASVATEQLIVKSFEFLLERESKESILRRFDLPIIGRYFPEYEKEIRRAFGVSKK